MWGILKSIPHTYDKEHEEMVEQYKGYEIKVNRNCINNGYTFYIFDLDGIGIKESGYYAYEENALLGARETIDEMIQKKGK